MVQNLTELKIASINAEGDLTLHTNPTGSGDIRILLLRRTGDALRPSTSGDEQNDYTMREGKFVASLNETSLISTLRQLMFSLRYRLDFMEEAEQ